MSRHAAARRRSLRVERGPGSRRRFVLRLAMLLGVLAIVATGLAWSCGVKSLVFTSGSMSPSIPTGSLAFSRTVDATDLAVGDVVSVANARDERVTHRVVAAQQRGEEMILVLQGDANSSTDPEPYVVTSVERVGLSVPVLGRVVSVLDSGAGLAVLVVGGALLVVVWPRPTGTRHRTRRASARGPVVTLALGTVVAGGALVLGAMPTQAYWTDDAAASSGTFTMTSPTPTPTDAVCTNTGDHVLTSWTNVGQRYGYLITLHRLDTGAQVGSPISVSATTTASVASEMQRTAFGAAPSTTGQANFELRVRAVPSGSTTWLSPTALAIPVYFQSGHTVLRCGSDTSTFVTITALGADSGSSGTDFITNVAANTLKGTGEPGATIIVRRGGVQIATATVAGAGTWTSTGLTLAEGLQDLTASATDLSGNTASATRSVRLDTVAPAVSITGLGTDSGSSNTDFVTNIGSNNLTGTGEPGATISITRAGTQIATATVAASGNWTSSVLSLAEGVQDVSAVASDLAGNSATALRSGVRLDTVAPSATQAAAACSLIGNAVTGVTGSTWCRVTSQSWTATFADNSGGSGLVAGTGSRYSNNGGAFTNYTAAVTMAEANGRVMRARATDVAGNSATATGTYYIDGTAPSLTITAPTSGLSLSLALLGPLLDTSCGGNIGCGVSSDAISGLAATSPVKWKLTLDRLINDTCYTATSTTSCTTYAFQNTGGTLPGWVVPRSRTGFYSALSTYIFQAQSTDQAGNVATTTVNFSTVL